MSFMIASLLVLTASYCTNAIAYEIISKNLRHSYKLK